MKATMLFLLAAVLAVPSLASAQETPSIYDEARELNAKEISYLEREVKRMERDLKNYNHYLERLAKAAQASTGTDRKRAVNDIEKSMRTEILAMEQRVGESHTIRMHGEDVASDVQGSAATPTRQKNQSKRWALEGGYSSPLYRMARMQEIYVYCQTNRQHAIDKAEPALSTYQSMAAEFGRLTESEMAALSARIPEDAATPTSEEMEKLDAQAKKEAEAAAKASGTQKDGGSGERRN